MTHRRNAIFLALAVSCCCLATTVAWGQSTARNRYGSSIKPSRRSIPVKYQAGEDADPLSADEILRQEEGGASRQTPPQQPMDIGPESGPSTEPDMIPAPMPKAPTRGTPSARPATPASPAPSSSAPYEVAPDSIAPQQTWEAEVDSFAGHDSWDGSGPGCCDSCGDGACSSGCCDAGCGCRGCGWYGRGEYLLMWTAGQDVPALVTTSPVGVSRTQAGVLGQPTTTILFGDGTLNTDTRSGARAGVGYWLSDCFAIEGEYLTIGDSHDSFALASSSNGVPTIARPFVDINGANVSNLVAANLNGAAAVTGNINIDAFSSFEGASVLLRYAAATTVEGCRFYQLDYLAGYRYARLRDRLSFSTSSRSVETASSVPVGTVIDVNEEFSTTNRFLGADFGVHMRCRNGCYTMDVIGRVAVGSVAREVYIDGNTVTSVPGQTAVTSQGGLLTQRTNIGYFRDDSFSVLPEVGIKLGVDLNSCLRLTAGYNFLALANVARAGEQIDTTINTTQAGNQPLAGAARPEPLIHDTGYWAHGVSFGLEGEF